MRRALFVFTALGILLACSDSNPLPTPAPGVTPDAGVTPGPLTCDATKACPNGAPCTDGYCCDSPCSDICEACNVPGKEGTCTGKTGAPVHGACVGDQNGPCAGSCDPDNRVSCTYPTAVCKPGTCTAGTATLPATCALGTCGASSTQACIQGCDRNSCLGVKQMAGGYNHICAVMTDGTVRCWGENDAGECGQTPAGEVTSPTPVPGLVGVTQVAATFDATCALLSDKTVKCFGTNRNGELGTGTADTVAAHPTPTAVGGVSDIVFLAGSSGAHFCAIDSKGKIVCWGGNSVGECGGGTTTPVIVGPTTVCQPDKTPCVPSSGATFVAGGDGHTCAVFAGGKVACWGSNTQGESGLVESATPVLVPTTVPGLTAHFLAAGNHLTCADTAGSLKCWGGNGLLALGYANPASTHVPQSVCTVANCSTLLTSVTSVSTYDQSTCAVSGGAVKCWGTDDSGQLGDGMTTGALSYASNTVIPNGAVAVVSSGQTNFAIIEDRANRDVRCWGSDGGHCGTGNKATDMRPIPVTPKW